jgi:hypothetical protein
MDVDFGCAGVRDVQPQIQIADRTCLGDFEGRFDTPGVLSFRIGNIEILESERPNACVIG